MLVSWLINLSRPVDCILLVCHYQGYTFAMDMHPYSRRLKELLFEQCKEPVEVS